MKLFTRQRTKEETLFGTVFKIAALGFIAVCAIGLATFFALDSTHIGVLIREGSYQSAYQFTGTSGMNLLTKLSIASFILIIIGSIMQFIWIFRIRTASKAFIYSVYAVYIIGQGIGFGYLFLTFQVAELFAIFGIAGGLFATMSLAGYISKDLSWMAKYLIVGSIFMMVIFPIILILTFTGVVDTSSRYGIGTMLFDLIFFFGLVLTLGYIMFTTWRIRKLSEYDAAYGMDADLRWRLIAFFAFRLMTDMVALIWYIARFFLRSQR